MKNVLFRVHGTPVERLHFYGGLLLLIGVWLNFIEVLLGGFLCGLGGWFVWYTLREGIYPKLRWVRHPLLVCNILLSILTPVLFIGTIFGWR